MRRHSVFLICCFFWPSLPLASLSSYNQSTPIVSQVGQVAHEDISVTMRVSKQAYRKDEVIPLRIEFRNVGTKPILLTKQLLGTNLIGGPDLIPISVQVDVFDIHGSKSKAMALAFDRNENSDQNASEYAFKALRWWVLLEPDQFYGTTLIIQPRDFEMLGTPGRYKLRVTVTGHGGYPPSTTASTNEEMPVPIWTGRAEWESPWIEIAPLRR